MSEKVIVSLPLPNGILGLFTLGLMCLFSAVEVLIAFYENRLKDHYVVTPPVLRGLAALVSVFVRCLSIRSLLCGIRLTFFACKCLLVSLH